MEDETFLQYLSAISNNRPLSKPNYLTVQNCKFLPAGQIAFCGNAFRQNNLFRYASYQENKQGVIKARQIPMNVALISHTPVMINIGRCIKAEVLLDFKEYVKSFVTEGYKPSEENDNNG